LINISDASNTINQVGSAAAPWFAAELPIGMIYVGIIAGGMLVAAIIAAVVYAIGSMAGFFGSRGHH